jgi:hypothetical protein
MPLQSYGTVLDIVQAATRQMSILVPTGVYDSLDENALAMGSNINNIGVMLLGHRKVFQQFRREWSLTGDGFRTGWDLPSDYGRLVNNTGWSYAMSRPVKLVSPTDWSAYKVSRVTLALQPIFRLMNDQFVFATPPAAGETITFEYLSRNWVIDGVNVAVQKESCSRNSDKPMFDFTLMVIATKMKWREAKGFDTQADTVDFNDRLLQLADADTPGDTMSLNGVVGAPLLSGWNLPITNYGS